MTKPNRLRVETCWPRNAAFALLFVVALILVGAVFMREGSAGQLLSAAGAGAANAMKLDNRDLHRRLVMDDTLPQGGSSDAALPADTMPDPVSWLAVYGSERAPGAVYGGSYGTRAAAYGSDQDLVPYSGVRQGTYGSY